MVREKRGTFPRRLIGLLVVAALQVGVCADTHSIFDDNWTPPPNAIPVRTPETGTTPATAPEKHPPTPSPTDKIPKPAPVIPVPGPDGKPPVPPAPMSTKYAPPDVAGQAQTMKLVKEVFEKEYADKAPSAKKQLAQALVGEAVKIKENYIARYVLLNEGYKAALAASDVVDCKTAIGSFDKYYAVDTKAMTLDTFAKLSSGPNGQSSDLAVWGVEAVERMVAEDDYSPVHKLIKLVETTVPQGAGDPLRERLKAAETIVGEYQRVRPAIDKLKATPDDPLSNLAVGKFYCFSKQDWVTGLQMLAKGSDPKLKDLAQQDIVEPSDALAQYSLAGQWWGKEKSPMQAAMRKRAAYWYEKAAPNLTGLQRVMAEKRWLEVAAPGNILTRMTPDQGADNATIPEGVRLSHGSLKSPEEFMVPIRIDVVAMTDSNDIRMKFRNGETIFNWSSNLSELRFSDPSGKINPIPDKGRIPINVFVHITWIIQDHEMKLYLNGEERGAVRGDFTAAKGYLWVYPASSTITVRSVVVAPLPRNR